jgi:flagellar basal-body rod protein FlgB
MIDSLFSNANYQAAKHLLDAAKVRHEALATNIANVETPGYKRTDLQKDFSQEFATRLRAGNMAAAPAPKITEDKSATSQRLDGNTVQLDHELLALGKNAAEYETLTEFVSGSIKQLKVAITGRTV